MTERLTVFDQAEYDIRCEWGRQGAALLAPISDAVIIVDVLSFSTAVEIATGQGAVIWPYRWRNESAQVFAESVAAIVADGHNQHGYYLSPASLQSLPAETRLVLPSPNGSEISLTTGRTPTLLGCLRNSRAVAESVLRKGRRIAVIPAGERWPDGTLRPCFEDLVGAGASLSHLRGSFSPEAQLAIAAFEKVSLNLLDCLKSSSSGKEKISRGEEQDVLLAAALEVSDCVPMLAAGAFKKEI